MTEQEMRDLFREMREEPVPADSLARVRLRVDQRIQHGRWAAPWKLLAALALAGCIVAGFFLLRPARTPVVIERPVAPEVARVEPQPEPPVPIATRPPRARPRPVEAVPVSIRIETPDPEVVILLVN